jgi:hypothetical protein
MLFALSTFIAVVSCSIFAEALMKPVAMLTEGECKLATRTSSIAGLCSAFQTHYVDALQQTMQLLCRIFSIDEATLVARASGERDDRQPRTSHSNFASSRTCLHQVDA